MKQLSWIALSAAVLVAVDTRAQEPTAEGRPASFWINALHADDMSTSLNASNVLVGMGEQAVPFVVRALRAERVEGQTLLLSTLGMMGPAARAAIPEISALLESESPAVQASAAATLVNIDCELWVKALPTLVAALDGDVSSATMAAGTIASLGSDGAAATPALTRLLSAATDREVRLRAMLALGSIGQAAHSAIPALRDIARGDDAMARPAEGAIEKITGRAPATPTCAERRRDWFHH